MLLHALINGILIVYVSLLHIRMLCCLVSCKKQHMHRTISRKLSSVYIGKEKEQLHKSQTHSFQNVL